MYPTILAVLLVLMTAPQLNAQSVPVQDRAAKGISLARQGNLIDAEKELRAAVSEAPSVAIYQAQLGSILGLQGKWNDALECFQKAVQLAPENLDFRRETAAVQWQMGLMPAAETNLQYVLEKRPGDQGALLLLGLVKEKTGDYTNAVQLLDSQFELVAAQPERTVALFHSVVESRQSDKVSKIVEVLKLHASDKSWVSAISRCTQLAIMGGDLQTAETLFSLIPADSSDHPATALQLAQLLYSSAQVSRIGKRRCGDSPWELPGVRAPTRGGDRSLPAGDRGGPFSRRPLRRPDLSVVVPAQNGGRATCCESGP
jgi:tetratricopeptide (TPR) repeat protein